MSSLTAIALKGTAWTLWGAGGQVVFRLLSLMLLARLLVPDDFGLFAICVLVVSFFSLLSQMGVKHALIHKTELTVDQIRCAFTLVTFLGLLFALLIIVASESIAVFFNNSQLDELLQVMVLLIVFQSLTVVAEAILQRESMFREIALIDLFSYVVGHIVVGITLAYFGAGVWSLVWAVLVQLVIKATIQFKITSHSLLPLFNFFEVKSILKYGGGILSAQLSNYIALQGDNLIVGKMLGMDALGLYSRAYSLMAMPATLFGGAIDKVLFPVMTKVKSEDDRLETAYRKTMLSVGMLLLPASLILTLISTEVVLVILGDGWDEVIPLLSIFFTGLFFRTAYKLSSTLVNVKGAVYKNAYMQLVYAFFVMTGAFVGQYWGVLGVAYGVLGAVFVNYTLLTMLSCKITNITLFSYIKIHMPCLLITFVLYVLVVFTLDLLRSIEVWPIFIIIITAGCYFFTLSMFLLIPNKILDVDLAWFQVTVKKYFSFSK